MFKFITNRPFWFNLLAALALAFLILYIFLQLLGRITNHGKFSVVPSVVGKKTVDAIKLLEKQGFEVEILDSVYTDTAKMGVVLKQLPDPNSTVKINRTVLLTVNRQTLPMVEVPSLEGKTLGFALEIMKRSHFKLGDTVFVPDFTRGSVKEYSYNGKRIQPGIKIPWGSRIDLVITGGQSDEQVPMPNLIGLTVDEAKRIIDEKGLILASMFSDRNRPAIGDTLTAFVVQQTPPRYKEDKEVVMVKAGQVVDLVIDNEMMVPFDSTGNF